MSQARHVGKVVLTLGAGLRPGGTEAEDAAPGGAEMDGTVLITGGTGALGRLLARHLVQAHRVRSLLLLSRRGPEAEGAEELIAELGDLGAHARIVACDVSDRGQLADAIDAAVAERPLSAVVHAAGVLDDGIFESLSGGQLERVLATKVDAAVHLHELTEALDLREFVLFSSAAGVFGAPGQANYAAANSFLDALASHRRARGLAGRSLAWGLWEQESEMTAGMGAAEVSRMQRAGVQPLSTEAGLAQFDECLRSGAALALPMRLDRAVLAEQERAGTISPLLRDLLRAPSWRVRGAVARGGRARQLAALGEHERRAAVLEIVLEHVAAVLGHRSASSIDVGAQFKELGFDSLIGVELRNRLARATGLQLPATLIFDHPTPEALAECLLGELASASTAAPRPSRAGRTEEPIAIVGIGCRYPGGVESAEDLWRLVLDEADAISDFPADRGWDLQALRHPDPDRPGVSWALQGSFLGDIAAFDADFFGITPREALAMDPQQRLLLEVCWEAIERASIDPAALRGTQTAVFAGVSSSSYSESVVHSPSGGGGYHLIGNMPSVASGRVAYTLGLEGPAVSIDTACSSSLVALHLACQALRQGECSTALAGGVTVMTSPALFVDFSRHGGLARDGRCKAFADAADGTGWSEGAGVLVLERLGDARRNGHDVLAIVRGSAVNQDGASNGLTAPNGPSQQRVIEQALASAGLSGVDVDAVEGHGTGTSLGDPIEAQALIATYGRQRQDEHPLWLGSVKSNIGHSVAAAGAAGVIKMVMAMREGVMPRTLHVDAPSSEIDWSSGSVRLLEKRRRWDSRQRPRRAGISSFGVSGTNAHLIVEQAPSSSEGVTPASELPMPAADRALQAGDRAAPMAESEQLVLEQMAWPLSARDDEGLRRQAGGLAESLERLQPLEAEHVGRALARRPSFARRAVLLGDSTEQMIAELGALGDQGLLDADSQAAGVGHVAAPADGVAIGAGGTPVSAEGLCIEGAVLNEAARTVFVFPGQGAQWPGMAVELLDGAPPFAEQIRRCEEALAPFLPWRVEQVLRGAAGAPGLERVNVVQPVLFAVMVSLAELWRSCGVRPGAVVGHSQGEIAAACVAGGLSLQDAACVIALRSRALALLSERGTMVSVAAGRQRLEELLESVEGPASIAALNGPHSSVASGEPAAMRELLGRCEAEGVRARQIPVDYAAHSAQVEEIEEQLISGCQAIEPRAGSVPFYSAAVGGPIDTAELGAAYWYRNLRRTVDFEGATRRLLADRHRLFIEMSPHPVLTVGVQETIDAVLPEHDAGLALGSLRRGEGSARFLRSLAEAWAHGATVDWKTVLGEMRKPVPLPTYPFRRERYWLAPAAAGAAALVSVGQSSAHHPLLGAAVVRAEDGGWLFTAHLSPQGEHRWLADHRALGAVVLPGTALLELALHAGSQSGCANVEELTIEAPLLLGEHGAQVQVSVGAEDGSGRRAVEIHARTGDGSGQALEPEEGWVRHACGVLCAAEGLESAGEESGFELLGGSWPPPQAQPLAIDDLYDDLAERGLEYGAAFRGVAAAWRHGEELLLEVALDERECDGAAGYALHPALLDAALHGIGLSAWIEEDDGQLRLPFSWRNARLGLAGASSLRVLLTAREGEVGLLAADGEGAPVLSVDGLSLRVVEPEGFTGNRGREESLFALSWIERTAGSRPAEGWWAALGEHQALDAQALGAGVELTEHPDLAALIEHVAEAGRAPEIVLAGGLAAQRDREPDPADLAEVAAGSIRRALGLAQTWFACESLVGSRLVFVTREAVSTCAGEELSGLVDSGVWGLIRSAQSEHPGRLLLVDVDGLPASVVALPVAIATAVAVGESQVAVRDGEIRVPRLRDGDAGVLVPPPDELCWRLSVGDGGALDELEFVACPEAGGGLGAGEVRVGMRAAGLNFRDVLMALGLLVGPDGGRVIGHEGAGVVLEVGAGVDGLRVGDRVMGLFEGCFGPFAVSDRRLLVRVPDGWSFAEAASVPLAFLTAYYGLVDLGGLRAGERVLVHAAAGGVGMAAVQLARHFGAEVFATASPPKWDLLVEMGVERERIASSRDLGFADDFADATGGEGVDVVLNSLADQFIDASLGLVGDGGRFVEMGMTDVRDPVELAAAHPGVSYRAFDLREAGPDRIQRMLLELVGLFERGVLSHLPVRAWDLGRAPEAFRFMSQGRHVGKVVLRVPSVGVFGGGGSVLVTGGTGVLGGLLARHLVVSCGVRSLVLVGRRGLGAPGVGELVGELGGLGAVVRVVGCDVCDRGALEGVVGSIGDLSAVVHAAGALDDGVFESLSVEQLDRVVAAKVDGAVFLHELTEGLDLREFVLFSSVAGVLGSAGQANYAAANAFLDGLAAFRRSRGLAGSSLAWGWWEPASGMTGGLGEVDVMRMRRAGVRALSVQEGLRLFDVACGGADALSVPVRFDRGVLRELAGSGALPVVLGGLVRGRARSGGVRVGEGLLARRLAGLGEGERRSVLVELLCGEVAGVLGLGSGGVVDPARAFKELGFDSLLGVELRNRVGRLLGQRLPATLVFDYPSVAELADYLLERVAGLSVVVSGRALVAGDRLEPLAVVGMACRFPGGVSSPESLWDLVVQGRDAIGGFPDDRGWDLRGLYDPDPDRAGTTYVREGGFLSDAMLFDAGFFGIGPREALAMDPQQRLLLEVCWEALEYAGFDPLSLKGSQTGVFAGISSQDYGVGLRGLGDLEGYSLTGASTSVVSGRVAYSLGLEGPAVTVDTACSSSLVAMHLACQALRAGECDLALAGGVTVLSTPGVFIEFARQRGLAADARCKPFSDRADGAGFSEGVGVVVLERLSAARRLGHRVFGLVRGSAVNQDGASNGLSAPNGPSQQRVIVQALANAGVDAGQVDVVEGHGTGTSLGDPIEAQALLATYGRSRSGRQPLWLGSVKSNIGHTQAAAGVAGVIKMLMAMREGVMPRSIHLDVPSSKVDWSQGAVSLLGEQRGWEAESRRPRRAGVSSFGISGTNAHLILEEAPTAQQAAGQHARVGGEGGEEPGVTGPAVWVLSGRGRGALRDQAARLLERLERERRG